MEEVSRSTLAHSTYPASPPYDVKKLHPGLRPTSSTYMRRVHNSSTTNDERAPYDDAKAHFAELAVEQPLRVAMQNAPRNAELTQRDDEAAPVLHMALWALDEFFSAAESFRQRALLTP